MPVYKRKTRRGKTEWFYQFEGPGSTRANRVVIKKTGFATKQDAVDAESERRTQVKQVHDLAKSGRAIDAPLPETLGALLADFFAWADEKRAPKTVERYREMAACLSAELLVLPFAEITPLHLSREWDRLLKSGGHTRRDKAPRPMSVKTVRNIAGVVSAAYGRGIKWGLTTNNPVKASEPPVVPKRQGMALTPQQQALMRDTASGPWCLAAFIEVAAATGARRGEVLALRWSDIVDGRATIKRSLSQTRKSLGVKGTKSERERVVSLPASTLAILEDHRKLQEDFRRQYGPGLPRRPGSGLFQPEWHTVSA
jgi:integrase